MKIIYPYNEILPTQRAHDSYLFKSCVKRAATDEVILLCGQGSLPLEQLHQHYHTQPSPHFTIKCLPILRKNTLFNVTYNPLFFFFCQREFQKIKPDIVILSVLKQGIYHLKRKVRGVHYVYEAHELQYYPGYAITPKVLAEKQMLARAEQVVVTTNALKEILQNAPYHLTTPIDVVPLLSTEKALPPPDYKEHLHLFYVGALYEGQGIALLLEALAQVKGVQLSVIGGKADDVAFYTALSQQLGIAHKVHFLGFQRPSSLRELVMKADLFVAPFEDKGRMAYVAHTKLYDYAAWQRPVIAPNLAIVKEHFKKGAILFEAGNVTSLAEAIKKAQKREVLKKLQEELKKSL